MIILDTNILSDPISTAPSSAVRTWLASYRRADLFTTAITQAEMLAGLKIMPAGKRRDGLTIQITGLFEEDFADRILPFDSAAAREFVSIARFSKGKPIMEPDRQIAAIALACGAPLATRNIKHFMNCGLTLIDPWTAE